jgi:hypothetical protein
MSEGDRVGCDLTIQNHREGLRVVGESFDETTGDDVVRRVLIYGDTRQHEDGGQIDVVAGEVS